jgi:hypothetical protein
MPRERLHHAYGRLTGFLKRVSLRLRLLAILQSFLLFCSGLLIVFLGGLCTDYLSAFVSSYVPFFYALLAILFLLALMLLALRRALFAPSLERVARGLEKKYPALRDDLTNSLLLYREIGDTGAPREISEGLIEAQIEKAADAACGIEPREAVSFKPVMTHVRFLLPLAALFSLVFFLDPLLVRRSVALIIHPFEALSVSELSITLEPGRPVVLRGAPLIIRARIKGKVDRPVTLTVWPEKGEKAELPMVRDSQGDFVSTLGPARFSFSCRASSGNSESPVHRIRVVDPPDIAALKLTLTPPGYSGLPQEVKEDGAIEALGGTLVHLEIRTTKPVVEGRIVLSEGNELPLKIENGHGTGTLMVFSPGSYSIRVRDENGFENPAPAAYQIRLLPDGYPEGEILQPARDLEVAGSEIIPIIYAAKDDFGLTAVRMNYELRGHQKSLELKRLGNGRSFGPDTFSWDLSTLALMAGESVTYRLEVLDNDPVSGPKKGYSHAYTFSVRDERGRVSKESEEAQQMADALLDLLADHLEGTKDKEALTARMEDLLKGIDARLQRMKDRPERSDLEGLKRNLSSLKERMHDEANETVAQEMERLALFAEDLAERAKMKELEALAREMKNRQRRLLDSLNELKGPPDRKDLESFMKELKNLRDLLRSVMEALANLATRLPDEFVNSPEIRGLDFQDVFKDLDEIEKNLTAGDIAGALAAAQRLMQALSEMMASLGKAGAQAGMAPFDRLQGELARQSGELGKIIAEQRAILRETEGIDRETSRMKEEEALKRWREALPDLEEALTRLEGLIPSEQIEVMEDIKKLLREGNLERFFEQAQRLGEGLPPLPEIEELKRHLREKAEQVRPSFDAGSDPQMAAKFPPLSSRERQVGERTQDIGDGLERMAQLFPGMDSEILRDIQEAARSMRNATGKLDGRDAGGALPPEEEAIRRLTRSQEAMQQMAQQMAMRMQAARGGYQLVYDPRAGWYYGPWVPMPTLPQPELNRPRQKGYTGFEKEEFDLPSKDAYKVPKLYRDKILESLKEETPSQYKREVERYFRGLTQ